MHMLGSNSKAATGDTNVLNSKEEGNTEAEMVDCYEDPVLLTLSAFLPIKPTNNLAASRHSCGFDKRALSMFRPSTSHALQ